MYSVYSVVHINHELHIRGSSDAQRADTKLLSSIVHQPFKQHNRLQSAAQVGGSSYPHHMRKKFIHLPFKQFHISDALQRTSLILTQRREQPALSLLPRSKQDTNLWPNSLLRISFIRLRNIIHHPANITISSKWCWWGPLWKPQYFLDLARSLLLLHFGVTNKS